MSNVITKPGVPVSEQAAAWYFELEHGRNDRDTRRQFVRWLKGSPQHIDAFLAIAALEQELAGMPGGVEEALALIDDAAGGAVPIGSAAAADPVRAASPPGRLGRWLAVAAAAAVAAFGTLWFLPLDEPPPAAVHRTDFGEQRSLALNDGSIVMLNTRTEVVVRYAPAVRHVELLSGEALFDVAADPARPFVVDAGAVALEVLGTKFSVYRTADATRLAVVEGVVRVAPQGEPGEPVLVHAGEGALASADGAIRREAAIDVDKAMAWTERRLVFEDVPLEEVVSEFNRYNRRPLLVQDVQLAERRVTSVFFANDVSALVAFLELEPDVEVDYGADAIRIHRKH